MTKIFNRYNQKQTRRDLRNKLTFYEIILWSKLKNRQINNRKFRRQHGIGNYIVDFFCPELKLVIEVDGADHFFDEKSEQYDSARQKYIENKGIKVIRFTNNEIRDNLDGVLEVIYRETSVNHPNPSLKRRGK
ncbi:MAG: endonuclease domain-containing protein [Patescibacteria group bacterium]